MVVYHLTETQQQLTHDDYEEGTFTATLADSGGGATLTLNSAYNALAYTKIGRQVHIQGVLVVSGVSGTANGTLQINNLPFASAGLVDQAGKSGGCGVSIYQVQNILVVFFLLQV